jgi:TRAP-type mannitol/chloroaromatic compound transport system substrate-binding protein
MMKTQEPNEGGSAIGDLRRQGSMRRRDLLAGAASLAAGVSMSFPAPAIAQGLRQLKMVTDWPDGTPGLHASAVRFAQTVGAATNGRIRIEVFPAGTFVRPFETFDAVGAGVADLYHSTDNYRGKQSLAFYFFAAMPFGFKTFLALSNEVVAEIGSGDDLCRKFYGSYEQFRRSITDWSDIAERAYLNNRRLA